MTIPKEIQDLMPERKDEDMIEVPQGENLGEYRFCKKLKREGFNAALTEVEAVLPQMLALAEKCGAERERGALRKNITNYVNTKFLDGVVIDPLELYEALTQPNHE